MVRLDATAQSTNIPVIIAAQLKRETNSPLDLYNQYIADSGWIERKASEILLMWSNKEKCKGEGTEKTLKRVKEEIDEDLGEKILLGSGGKLYLKLTKSRVIPSGSHAIIPINGNTGRVGEPKKRGEATQQEMIFFSPSIYDNDKVDTEKQKPYRDNDKDGEELPF